MLLLKSLSSRAAAAWQKYRGMGLYAILVASLCLGLNWCTGANKRLLERADRAILGITITDSLQRGYEHAERRRQDSLEQAALGQYRVQVIDNHKQQLEDERLEALYRRNRPVPALPDL